MEWLLLDAELKSFSVSTPVMEVRIRGRVHHLGVVRAFYGVTYRNSRFQTRRTGLSVPRLPSSKECACVVQKQVRDNCFPHSLLLLWIRILVQVQQPPL